MSRLTKRINNPNGKNIVVYTAGKFIDTTAAEMTSSDVRTVLRVLADYEDAEENNEQQVRHGKWLKINNSFFTSSDGRGGNIVKCSVCGEPSACNFATPYCPICGAKNG